MKSYIAFCTCCLLLLSGCSAQAPETHPIQSVDRETIWVFAQFNIPDDTNMETYYYYGRITEELYTMILDGQKTEGFILLRDIRYWNDDDQIEAYEDEDDNGSIIFKIEHLVKLDRVKADPLTRNAPPV